MLCHTYRPRGRRGGRGQRRCTLSWSAAPSSSSLFDLPSSCWRRIRWGRRTKRRSQASCSCWCPCLVLGGGVVVFARGGILVWSGCRSKSSTSAQTARHRAPRSAQGLLALTAWLMAAAHASRAARASAGPSARRRGPRVFGRTCRSDAGRSGPAWKTPWRTSRRGPDRQRAHGVPGQDLGRHLWRLGRARFTGVSGVGRRWAPPCSRRGTAR